MSPISEEAARERIAKRIAQEINSSEHYLFVNTGVGIPTLVPNFIENGNVIVQAENGILGFGAITDENDIDPQLINASRQPIKEELGCCYFDSATSFGMIRGGHIDVAIIGAFEVDQKGNVANWLIPNGKQLGVGGAMDLVAGARKVIIAMRHTNKNNKAKIKKECILPITGYGEADMVVTEYAVFSFSNGRMVLEEIAPDISLTELKLITEAEYEISPHLRIYKA